MTAGYGLRPTNQATTHRRTFSHVDIQSPPFVWRGQDETHIMQNEYYYAMNSKSNIVSSERDGCFPCAMIKLQYILFMIQR